MREIGFCLAILLLQLGLVLYGADRSEREEGPGLPGGATDWAGSPEVPNAWKIQVRRGPGGECPDPNPHPENDPKGILAMTHEPNGPDRTPGPKGMSFEYYVSLMDDHYAGPNGMD